MRTLIVAVAAAAAAAVLTISLTASTVAEPAGAKAQGGPLTSRIARWDEAPSTTGRWGEFRRHFTGVGAGVKDILAGGAVVKAGEALHKAHQHAEEEFLIISRGSGTWHLDGKEYPLKKGDILYVAPWVMHGFTNTGDGPVEFYVVRWNGKGVPVPPKPEG